MPASTWCSPGKPPPSRGGQGRRLRPGRGTVPLHRNRRAAEWPCSARPSKTCMRWRRATGLSGRRARSRCGRRSMARLPLYMILQPERTPALTDCDVVRDFTPHVRRLCGGGKGGGPRSAARDGAVGRVVAGPHVGCLSLLRTSLIPPPIPDSYPSTARSAAIPQRRHSHRARPSGSCSSARKP